VPLILASASLPPPTPPGDVDLVVVEAVANPPAFWVDMPSTFGGDDEYKNATILDTFRLQITLAGDTSFASVVEEITHPLTAPNLANDVDEPINVSGLDELAAGDYIARCRLERIGATGNWSATTASFTVPAATSPITFGQVTHYESTANASSYTFTNAAPISATDGDWLICIGFRGGSPPSISTVTAKGQACTVRHVHNSSTNKVAIYSVHLTAAAAGDVFVSLSGSVDRCGIGVVEIIGAGSLVPTDTDQTTGTDPASVTLTVPVDGAAVGLVLAPTATSYTWSGMTEQFDVNIESGVIFSMATMGTTVGGDFLLSADAAGSALNPVGLFVAWGP
jgi:hypothetical protein